MALRRSFTITFIRSCYGVRLGPASQLSATAAKVIEGPPVAGLFLASDAAGFVTGT